MGGRIVDNTNDERKRDDICRHGWRGAKPTGSEGIANRCPACGLCSLFIAHNGWITCGNLECHDPDTWKAFEAKMRGSENLSEDDVDTGDQSYSITSKDGKDMLSHVRDALWLLASSDSCVMNIKMSEHMTLEFRCEVFDGGILTGEWQCDDPIEAIIRATRGEGS